MPSFVFQSPARLLRSRLHILAHLWVDLTREMSRIDQPKAGALFGSELPDLLISTAVYVGMVEDRPLTASQLARAVGLPRTTVLRRLSVLERAGRVERRGLTWRTPLQHVLRLEQADLEALAALIRAHAAELEG